MIAGEIDPVEYYENPVVTKNGEERLIAWHNTVLKDDRENIIGSLSSGEDITENKQAEEALRESEERFKILFEFAPDGYYMINMEGKFVDGNRAAEEIAGHKREELIGKDFYDSGLLSADQALKASNVLNRNIQGLKVGPEEFTLTRKDGTPIIVEIRTYPVKIKNENLILGIARDISERKKAEEKRKELENQLIQAQKMESIGTLAGGIAHDFNNILSPIMAHTEMALMDLPEDSPISFGLKEVYKASERARSLVKQILAFSRQTEHEPIPLKLGLVIEEALKLLRSSIPTTIEIQKKIMTDSDATLADPTQMHQVIMNLCTNAFHSMREKGGILEVSLAEKYVDIESSKKIPELNPGAYLKLSVKDSGQGIDADVVDKIFEPYFTTKDKEMGTGLGLAVVHGIVKNHGGSIQVSSELGKGTISNVYLPKLETSATEKTPIEEPVPRGDEKVLYIDDEAAIIEVAKNILEHLGYKVVTRASSTDALELFRSQPDQFDIVITDMTMPNMTGKQLAKELMIIRPDIPIILCTGFSEHIDERTANEMGIRALVMKPIIMREIAYTLRKVLDKKDMAHK